VFDRASDVIRQHQHVNRAALDEQHEDGAADEGNAEGCDERAKGDRLRRQEACDGPKDVPKLAVQQIGQIGPEQDSHEDGCADDGHRQHRLKCRLRGELDGDGLPVGRRQQRAALQKELQTHESISL